MLKIIDPIYTKLGFNAKPEDSHLDILLRKKAVRIKHFLYFFEMRKYRPSEINYSESR